MKEYRRSTGTMTALLSGRSTDVRKAEVNRDELTAITETPGGKNIQPQGLKVQPKGFQ
jgi:hypothetical protein